MSDSVRAAAERRFPIQDGPSVPWSYMAPHESMAKTNHGQTLKRLAERGGLGAGEAELIVTGRRLRIIGDDEWDELKRQWIARAERVNNAYLAEHQPDEVGLDWRGWLRRQCEKFGTPRAEQSGQIADIAIGVEMCIDELLPSPDEDEPVTREWLKGTVRQVGDLDEMGWGLQIGGSLVVVPKTATRRDVRDLVRILGEHTSSDPTGEEGQS